MSLYQKNYEFVQSNNDRFFLKKGFCYYKKDYILNNSKEGYKSLSCVFNNSEITIHSRYYPLKEAEKFVDAFHSESNQIVVFGCGLGYHLLFLSQKFKNKQIIVIDPDKHLFNLMLHQIDITSLKNCSYIIGFEDFEITSKIKIIENADIFKLKQRVALQSAYFLTLEKRIRKRPVFNINDDWKYPKFQNEMLNIIFIDSGYVLSQEVMDAIKKLGHNLKYIHIDQNDYDYEIFIKNFLNLVIDFKPDFVLTINHLGFDKSGRMTELLTELELPFASWYVDSPNVILQSYDRNISDFCNIFVWDKDYIEDVKKVGYQSVQYLPLATMPDLFRPMNLTYKSNVSFVGSSMVFAIHKNLKSMVSRPDLLSKLDIVANRFLEKGFRFTSEAIESLIDEGNNFAFDDEDQKADFEAAVLWRATQKYRLSGILKLAEFYPTIRGDSNWDRFLDFRFNIGREVWYYDEMPQFYNSSKINFNMTSCQMKNAVNQRVFDVPACQQFLLTDYKSQLDEIFDKNEIVSFSDIDEIPDLVRFYLNNESERKRIALAGYKKIMANETYVHRLKKMISFLKKRYR